MWPAHFSPHSLQTQCMYASKRLRNTNHARRHTLEIQSHDTGAKDDVSRDCDLAKGLSVLEIGRIFVRPGCPERDFPYVS